MIRLKNQFTRRVATVSAIIIILILSVAITAISSSMQNSYAQTGVGSSAANTCQKLPITSVSAGGNDGRTSSCFGLRTNGNWLTSAATTGNDACATT